MRTFVIDKVSSGWRLLVYSDKLNSKFLAQHKTDAQDIYDILVDVGLQPLTSRP